ncbi:MAG TPA: nicotinate-nucleotide adenylyltransferase [Bacteroidales bacterium]|jgi:hypothetical protein|nr:nicotinate-nucleotide adenylyltransferase [Bacteroidales bacterium]
MKGTIEKALKINLDPQIYGTIAEIGAGQEVARNFFVAGAAAGTIAKTMSAYDMQFSDAIYGAEPDGRYVSYSRVNKMIDREYNLVLERLENHRPEDTKFFAFADTIAAKGFKSAHDCHGWLGVKFQSNPLEQPNKIILHVRLRENSNLQQQQTLGQLGINLIYAAYYLAQKPLKAIESLLDSLSTERIEIDMIEFAGPQFKHIDNRLMAVHLVRCGLTHSVFFTRNGNPVQGSDLLYRKHILALRGSFRPFTIVHQDMLHCAREAFLEENNFREDEMLVLTELSMSHLLAFGNLDETDFLGRVDTLCKMGFAVQISDFARFHELKCHLHQFTKKQVSIVLGIKNIVEIFSHGTYEDLTGGRIEGLGKLFSRDAKLYVYPKLLKDGVIRMVTEMTFKDEVKFLFQHFLLNRRILPLKRFNPEIIDVFTRDTREAMKNGDSEWEEKVPEVVAEVIKSQKLFGLKQ